jgi:hypothetical protein
MTINYQSFPDIGSLPGERGTGSDPGGLGSPFPFGIPITYYFGFGSRKKRSAKKSKKSPKKSRSNKKYNRSPKRTPKKVHRSKSSTRSKEISKMLNVLIHKELSRKLLQN